MWKCKCDFYHASLDYLSIKQFEFEGWDGICAHTSCSRVKVQCYDMLHNILYYICVVYYMLSLILFVINTFNAVIKTPGTRWHHSTTIIGNWPKRLQKYCYSWYGCLERLLPSYTLKALYGFLCFNNVQHRRNNVFKSRFMDHLDCQCWVQSSSTI